MSQIPERFGQGEWPDPAGLPAHLRRLHRRIMAAHRSERERQQKTRDVDETGRVWPGLVNPPPRQPNP